MPHRIVKCNRKYNNELVDDGKENVCLFDDMLYTYTNDDILSHKRADWIDERTSWWFHDWMWMSEGWLGMVWNEFNDERSGELYFGSSLPYLRSFHRAEQNAKQRGDGWVVYVLGTL